MSESPDSSFELWLRGAAAPDPDAEAEGPHIPDALLAQVAERAARLEPAQLAHIATCAPCGAALAAAGEEAAAQPPVALVRPLRRPVVKRVAAGLMLAAALALVSWWSVRLDDPAPSAGWRARGGLGPPAVEGAAVALLATDAAGRTRDLASGARVELSERIGFLYGNPAGEHHTLVIAGWDGSALHWYYPEDPARPALALASGPEARGVRLPFDVSLAEDHRPGPLTVAAVFDRSPAEVAAALEAGALAPGPHVVLLRLQLVEPPP